MRNHPAGLTFHRIYRINDLHGTLAEGDWGLVFCDLEMSDFTAFDLVTLLSDEGIDVPVILINGTGAKAIAIRCLEFGICQFIERDEHYLQALPLMVDILLRRAGQDEDRRLMVTRLRESEERYVDILTIPMT